MNGLDLRPVPAGQPVTIEGAARAVGGWAWAEATLYKVVGGWAASCSGPVAKVYLDSASQHHAWRADLWQRELGGRLVQAYGGPGPSPADVTGPASARAEELVAELALLEGDVERLAAETRIALPALISEYRRYGERLSTASGRPLARALRFAMVDAVADVEEGEALLGRLMEGEGAAQGTFAVQERLARLASGEEMVFGA